MAAARYTPAPTPTFLAYLISGEYMDNYMDKYTPAPTPTFLAYLRSGGYKGFWGVLATPW